MTPLLAFYLLVLALAGALLWALTGSRRWRIRGTLVLFLLAPILFLLPALAGPANAWNETLLWVALALFVHAAFALMAGALIGSGLRRLWRRGT